MSPEAFKQSLEALGLSYAAAGEFLGLSKRHVTRFATGEWPVPPAIAKLLRLMRHYGVNPADFD